MRNRSLAQLTAKSSLIPLVVAIGLLAGSYACAADPVYKWKDSSGQSHYSQQPPEKGVKYETITPSGASTTVSDSSSGPADAAAAPKNLASAGTTPGQIERQKLCESARKNVDTLTNRPLVEMDINGTGTPVRLNPDQQAQQLEIAKKQATALCGK